MTQGKARFINGGRCITTMLEKSHHLTGVDVTGNLLVGTTSAYGTNVLNVNGGIAIDGRNASTPGLCEKGDTDTGIYWPAANALSVSTGGTERMRVDSSGNLLVGKTTTSNATAGAELNASGQIVGTFASGTHILGRNTNDGSILEFQKNGTKVGRQYMAGGVYLEVHWRGQYERSAIFPRSSKQRQHQ